MIMYFATQTITNATAKVTVLTTTERRTLLLDAKQMPPDMAAQRTAIKAANGITNIVSPFLSKVVTAF